MGLLHLCAQLPICKLDRTVHKLNGKQKSLQAIKILLRDRIVLVVVTLRALQRQAKKDRSNGRGDLIQHQLTRLSHDGGLEARAETEETQRDLRFGRLGRQLVPRNLFLNESVVRLVVVKGPYYVVAVPPHVVVLAIGLETL